jgi:DNA-binding MarR family transcriptional regulator
MTGLLKSQMNKTICEMENIGYIKRTRSTDDRRVVYIKLTKKGIDAYHLSHEKTMLLMDALASSLGEEKSIQTAETLSLVADEMKTILKEGLK